MVVLTIVAPSNDHTVYFDRPIPKPNYIRLLSCSLYNSWFNLKKIGKMSFFSDDDKETVKYLLQGHYTLEALATEMKNQASRVGVELETEMNTSVGQMNIYNLAPKKIILDSLLAQLLGINPRLLFITYVKRLVSPSTYFIHCDMIDKEQNLLNGKPSSILARFDIKGKPFEKVHYKTAQQHMSYVTHQQINTPKV